MKLFIYTYQIDKFQLFSHKWGTGGGKSCSEYIFVKKIWKDCSTLIILNLE